MEQHYNDDGETLMANDVYDLYSLFDFDDDDFEKIYLIIDNIKKGKENG